MSHMEVQLLIHNPDFFVAKPTQIILLSMSCLSRMDSNPARKLVWSRGESRCYKQLCADFRRWSRQIRRYNNSPPYVTGSMAASPIALTQGQKGPDSPF